MADGIKIEIFKQKNAEELTRNFADPESKLETGSAAAVTAALSASLLERAAALTQREYPAHERVDYILRNAGILHGYMVHLIDEDVKCRAPLRRAMKEGGEREIEAARQPAVAIAAEIVNMMGQALELMKELCALCPRDALHYLGEAAELAMAAVRSARLYIVDMSDKCSDDTYRFVVRRENEITLKNCAECADEILAAVEAVI
ncbi:MAG: cyclodeaminase/cyclohydrolase family protein [Oscillospiraceae bacterium]|nr:cyclodeaminase/cyclohydrolase family protein [Oscillospiraceae bacterium]